MALQGTKALETWCRLVTEGYNNVNIMNMTTSWRNGMGFCAIIHKFRPELILFDSLDPEDAFGNNELAFTTAEQHLGIPALLDPQDMVECEVLDRLSILTYLSQFYQTFHGATGPSKDNTPTKLRYITGSSCSSGSSTPSKSSKSMIMLPGKRSEPCKICNKPVFILERLNVSGRLLHRTCFKCARCGHQLSIANYYETETGAYCCDMCPDEEVIQTEVAEANKKLVKTASMEDESGAEDDNSLLPESLQKQSDDTNSVNNNNVVDEENNPVKNDVCQAELQKTESIDIEKEPVESNIDTLAVDFDEKTDFNKDIRSMTSDETTIEPDTTVVPESDTIKNETKEIVDKSSDHESEIEEEKEEEKHDVEINVDDSKIRETEAEVESEISEEKSDDHEKEKSDEMKSEKDEVSVSDDYVQLAASIDVSNECFDEKTNEFDTPECDQSIDNQPVPQSDFQKEVVADPESYPEDLNPFGSDDEENTVKVSNVSTNPFGSDSEPESEEQPQLQVPPPKPPRLSLNPFGSDFEDDDDEEDAKKHKKKRRAPPPPPLASKSTPEPTPRLSLRPPPRPPPPKSQKDKDNIHRRSLNQVDQVLLTPMSPNKSDLDGKWKKKKGPAPPRPIPPKRQVKKLPRKAVNNELVDIEIKQQELERQGVDLEKTIREVCEKSDKERAEAGLDNNDRDSLGPEAEDLIVQLFELVNEKNELFRRQTELMYMKREHRLEEEHADIEHQIRVLMAKPDALRTDEDKVLEDKLIDRLMAIVSQRNEIVDCLEMDRLRELEEDESIEIHLGEYAAIKPPDEEEMLKKKKETKKKEKKKKKKDKAYDVDKDIDTSEFPSGGASLTSSPRPSPKKAASPLVLNDKEKAKKLKKKLLSTLKPITIKR